AFGASEYDAEARAILLATEADAALVVVVGGKRGGGASLSVANGDPRQMVEILRDLATSIEDDCKAVEAEPSVLFPAWCAEAWVATQAFRNLGFVPEEIFFGVGRSIVVSVQRDGIEFVWTIAQAPADETDQQLELRWAAFVTHMNQASEAERKAVWDCSDIVSRG